MAKKRRRGDRFPLLVYAPLGRRWGNLGLLLSLTSFILWWFAPRVLGPVADLLVLRHAPLLMVLAGGFLVVYGFAARRMAYVQCFSTYLRIQTPIYPLVVSYRRIAATRPVQMAKIFDPEREKAARRLWPARYWTMTAVAVELKSLPMSERWLRLWFDRYLFAPEVTGFVFLVEDWIGFSRQLEGFRAAYKARRTPNPYGAASYRS